MQKFRIGLGNGMTLIHGWFGRRSARPWVAAVVLTGLVYSADADLAEPPSRKDLAGSLSRALSQSANNNQAQVAVVVVDALTGETLFANRHANEGFIPASNMKLVTSATSLDLYGPEAELTTTLAIAGNDLIVIGTGDPGFGDPTLAARQGRTAMSVLDDWATALRDAGVVRIRGDLVVIDTVFDDELFHPTWSAANRLQWYGAPVAGVNFNDNCVDFTFVPTTRGKAATIETVPPVAGDGFVIRGKIESRGDGGEHAPVLDKRPTPDKNRSVYAVRGGITQTAGPYSRPVDDPRRFLGETLKAHLATHGITVRGDVRLADRIDARTAQRSRVIAKHQTPLVDVLGRVNTNSQNMMAEALAKLNGWAHELHQGNDEARGTWAGGHAAAVAFLQSQGIDTQAVVSADGSGLSRENRVSAAVLAQLLETMLTEHEHGEHFLNSLAISGTRGSLVRRLQSLNGRVYAKTGTIRRVSTLSGYVFAENGRVAIFSIMHNGNGSGFRGQQDRAVEAIAAWLEGQPAVEIEDPEVIEAMEHVGLLTTNP
ncbi:MAG: D-alanyl-D-alanine carboxypeptidase/D-alanyl-D-alanine-endopeptidase [Planctomycetota bacterium]